ncbi:MAG TPA: hypothetical protein VFV97_09410, partial [Rhodanobacteraceae bacterium]|nr:hypothetical protein [Rhodanobacteraceae bacterium]
MRRIASWLAGVATLGFASVAFAADPLPSWNDGAAKQSIVAFVAAVTENGGKDFVPVDERIAAFDNDGTLWIEQPLYVQAAFMLDELKASAPNHPEWNDNAAFKALSAHDQKALAAIGQKPVLELLGIANSGMTVGAYDKSIRDWLATARHPKYQRAYTELVYVP